MGELSEANNRLEVYVALRYGRVTQIDIFVIMYLGGLGYLNTVVTLNSHIGG